MLRICILVLTQYWEEDEGGITDQAGGTLLSISVLGDHNSPF